MKVRLLHITGGKYFGRENYLLALGGIRSRSAWVLGWCAFEVDARYPFSPQMALPLSCARQLPDDSPEPFAPALSSFAPALSSFALGDALALDHSI